MQPDSKATRILCRVRRRRLLSKQELHEIGKVLPPELPRMPNVRSFRVRHLDAYGIQIVFELPVRWKCSEIGRSAGDPKQLDLSV